MHTILRRMFIQFRNDIDVFLSSLVRTFDCQIVLVWKLVKIPSINILEAPHLWSQETELRSVRKGRKYESKLTYLDTCANFLTVLLWGIGISHVYHTNWTWLTIWGSVSEASRGFCADVVGTCCSSCFVSSSFTKHRLAIFNCVHIYTRCLVICIEFTQLLWTECIVICCIVPYIATLVTKYILWFVCCLDDRPTKSIHSQRTDL